MGNITIQGDLTGDVPGGEVGGASNLTTVGAIPYVSASGILNQDAALNWDASLNQLKLATDSQILVGVNQLQLLGSGGLSLVGTISSTPFLLRTNGTERMRLDGTTGNLLIGTTTDSNFKLDVAASGSAGTARFYGGSGVSDTTKVVVRAGAGQSTTNLTEWQNAAGGVVGGFSIQASQGVFSANVFESASGFYVQNSVLADASGGLLFGNNKGVFYSSTTNYFSTKDLSLTRASAGVLQVGDGGSNANGTVQAASLFAVKDANVGSGSSFAIQSRNATNNNLRVGIGYSSASGGVIQAYEEGVSFNRPLLLNPSSGNLLIGTTTDDGTNKLQVATPAGAIVANTAFLSPSMANGNKVYLTIGTSSSSNNSFTWLYNHSSTSSSRYLSVQPYEGQIGSSSTWFASSNMTVGDVTAAPLDPGFRFSVRSSGSSGTFRIFDEVSPTGVTKAVIRAGAGQGTTNLTEWQDSGGVARGRIDNIGQFAVIQSGGNFSAIYGDVEYFANNKGIFWSSTASATGSSDLGLYRSAAGVLEINNGTTGTYRDLILRRSQHNGVTVADLPAAAAGNAGSIQYVTDANATTIGSTVAGGGANKVMVWSDGAAWKIFAS